jgi:hypothetical protein
MTDELMSQFARIQNYAAALHGLLAAAQTRAPQRSEGVDRSGVVHVVLGPDGLPAKFRVNTDWQRRIEPAAFGDAVLEACRVAVGERMAAWTRSLENEGWQERLEGLGDGPPGPGTGSVPDHAMFMAHQSTPDAQPRPIGEVTEDVFRAFDDLSRWIAQPPQPASGSGTAGGRRLLVTLSKAGLISCTADPRWVAAQTAPRLTTALDRALSEARQDLANKPEEPSPGAGLDGLLTEIMALLHDPGRTAD